MDIDQRKVELVNAVIQANVNWLVARNRMEKAEEARPKGTLLGFTPESDAFVVTVDAKKKADAELRCFINDQMWDVINAQGLIQD